MPCPRFVSKQSQSASDKAKSAKETAKDAAGDAKDAVKAKASEMKDSASKKASEVIGWTLSRMHPIFALLVVITLLYMSCA